METNLEIELNLLRNCFGPLNDERRQSIRNVVNYQTIDTWEDAYCTIIRANPMMTLWQAVIEVSPSFPRTGRSTDGKGRVVKEWRRLPTKKELIDAIRYAAYYAAEMEFDKCAK